MPLVLRHGGQPQLRMTDAVNFFAKGHGVAGGSRIQRYKSSHHVRTTLAQTRHTRKQRSSG